MAINFSDVKNEIKGVPTTQQRSVLDKCYNFIRIKRGTLFKEFEKKLLNFFTEDAIKERLVKNDILRYEYDDYFRIGLTDKTGMNVELTTSSDNRNIDSVSISTIHGNGNYPFIVHDFRGTYQFFPEENTELVMKIDPSLHITGQMFYDYILGRDRERHVREVTVEPSADYLNRLIFTNNVLYEGTFLMDYEAAIADAGFKIVRTSTSLDNEIQYTLENPFQASRN